MLKKFRDIGLLGMNERNVGFILKYNKRSLYPLVDNKNRSSNMLLW